MKPETSARAARELATYERQRAELERKYPGRIALLHGDELLGVFKTWEKAVKMAWDRFGAPEQCYWQEIGKRVHLTPIWWDGPGPDQPPRPPEPPFEVKFAKELATYERHRAELERDHWGKFALLHRDEVVGVFKDEYDAFWEGDRRFGMGHFILQEIGDPIIDISNWIEPVEPALQPRQGGGSAV